MQQAGQSYTPSIESRQVARLGSCLHSFMFALEEGGGTPKHHKFEALIIGSLLVNKHILGAFTYQKIKALYLKENNMYISS